MSLTIDKKKNDWILIGAWVNALGISLRAFSTTSWIPSEYQYQFSLVGQSVASCAQPFVFFIPTKVAEKWFPEHQRALATTIIGMANPVGMMIATASASSLLSVQCIFSGIPLMNLVWSVSAIICVLLATFGVCSSTPPTPPSSSAAVITHQPYSQGIRELFPIKAYLLLLLCLGCPIGMFSVLITLMEQILTPQNYGEVSTWVVLSSDLTVIPFSFIYFLSQNA